MVKFADIIEVQKDQRKIEFNDVAIYELLKKHLGFRYTEINKKGYFLKLGEDGYYEITGFITMFKTFEESIKSEFENIKELKGLDQDEFLMQFYNKHPLENKAFLKRYLSNDFKLSKDNLHKLLLKVDDKYREKFKEKEMLDFLQHEQFVETIDQIGNFAPNKPLFYKRLSSSEFLAFNQPSTKERKCNSTFDFWRVKVDSESQFLSRKLDRNELVGLKTGFVLDRDINIYNLEVNI